MKMDRFHVGWAGAISVCLADAMGAAGHGTLPAHFTLSDHAHPAMNAVGTQAIFTWPRTDGSPSRWPSTGEHTMNPNGTWYESLPRTHPRFVQYEEKVGQWLVENGHVPAEEESMSRSSALSASR